MATNKRFTVSVLVDVDVRAKDEDAATDKVFAALETAVRGLGRGHTWNLSVQGVEYQNDTGEMLFEDYR